MTTLSKRMFSCFLSIVIILGIVACPVFSNDSHANTTRASIVAEARKWVDVTNMGSANHHALIDYYNSQLNAHPEYLDSRYCGYANYNTDWCAIFVTVVAMKCNATDVIFPESACWVVPTYQANGTWIESDAYVPSQGDLIFYNWDDSGNGDCTGDPYHVGIVESCDGSTITAIEGNTTIGDKYAIGVHRRYISVNGRYIRGFAVPRYSGSNSSSSSSSSGMALPSKKFEPSTDYYAFIIRPDVWRHLDISGNNNVQITTTSNETDSSKLWRFERQSDGSFAIFNQKNGYCLDASGAGTSSGTNVIAYSNYTGASNQRWFLYDTGAGTVIRSAASNLVLDCTGGYADPGTNIQLWEYNNTQAQRFNVYLTAKRTDLASESADAYLIRKEPWLHLENSSSGNVQIRSNNNDSLDPKQIWHFQKQSDGSYQFSTAYTSDYVSVYLTAVNSTGNGANVYTAKSSAIDNVKNSHYYLYRLHSEYGGGIVLRVKGREQVLTCKDGASSAGTNIILNPYTNTQGQIFEIWYLSTDKRSYSRPGNPNAPTVTVPSNALISSYFNISWTSSPLKSNDFDKRSYRVEILDSNNNVVNKINTTALTATTKFDTAGIYSIRVRAINTKYPGDSISSVSTSKTIVITKPVKTLTSAMVSNIPDQKYNGSAIRPSVTIMDGSSVLKAGTDYDVAYSNNVNAGKAMVTITGKGNYNGTVTVEFQIIRATYVITVGNVKNGMISLSKTSAYEGEEITVNTIPDAGYELNYLSVNGDPITGNKFTMPAKNTTVEVSFKQVTISAVPTAVPDSEKTVVPTNVPVKQVTDSEKTVVPTNVPVKQVLDSKKTAVPTKVPVTQVPDSEKTTVPTKVPVTQVTDSEKAAVTTQVPVMLYDTIPVGKEFTFDGSKLKVTGDTSVEYVKSSDDSIVKVPSSVELGGMTYIVTSIADKAFMNKTKLTEVIIGKNITKIGDNAFYGCKKLKRVSGGENVKTIGVGAFMECTKLKSITIGPKVTSIGASAFQGDKSLKTVIVKSKKLKAKKVGANAFKGIAKKAVFKIPKSKAKKYQSIFKRVSKGTKIKFKKI